MADMELSLGNTHIKERVYIVHGATKLLQDIPPIRERGLIHEIPGTYSVRAISCDIPDKPSMPKPNMPSRFANKEDILKEYPNNFTGLGKLKGEYTISLRDGVKPFCLTAPRRVPLPLMKKVEQELKRTAELGGYWIPRPPMVKGWSRLLPARRESLPFSRGLLFPRCRNLNCVQTRKYHWHHS